MQSLSVKRFPCENYMKHVVFGDSLPKTIIYFLAWNCKLSYSYHISFFIGNRILINFPDGIKKKNHALSHKIHKTYDYILYFSLTCKWAKICLHANRVGHGTLMGELGFEEYFFSLMDGGFVIHRWGEKGRCRQQQQQTQEVPGGLKMEENGGQIHREERTSHDALVPPLFPQLINTVGEKNNLKS